MIGALLEIEPASATSPAHRSSATEATSPALLDQVGRSAAWRAVREQAAAYRDQDVPLLFIGEPGVGKLSLISALFAEEAASGRLEIFDATLQPIDGAAQWVNAVRQALPDKDRIVVIRHLEALERAAAQALGTLVDEFRETGARLVATLTRRDGEDAYPALADRFAVATIEIPPLRHRLEDVPDLLQALTRKHASGPVEPRWLPEAVQTLSRLDWPDNIRQLENLVRRVHATRRSADIRASDLPDDVRRQAPRRKLRYVERAELDVMMSALRQAKGNKTEAAELMGISRATLYRKIRSFGVDLDNLAY